MMGPPWAISRRICADFNQVQFRRLQPFRSSKKSAHHSLSPGSCPRRKRVQATERVRWERLLPAELSQTPLLGPQPVQDWSRKDLENAASSRRSWLTPNQPSVGSSFRNITLVLELNIDLANCVSLYGLWWERVEDTSNRGPQAC